jgi:hypothetical protein
MALACMTQPKRGISFGTQDAEPADHFAGELPGLRAYSCESESVSHTPYRYVAATGR